MEETSMTKSVEMDIPESETRLESKEIAEATKELIKSTTITPKFCVRCGTKIGTNCIAKGCTCSATTPEICVRCQMSEIEHKNKDAPEVKLDENEEFLEWKWVFMVGGVNFVF